MILTVGGFKFFRLHNKSLFCIGYKTHMYNYWITKVVMETDE